MRRPTWDPWHPAPARWNMCLWYQDQSLRIPRDAIAILIFSARDVLSWRKPFWVVPSVNTEPAADLPVLQSSCGRCCQSGYSGRSDGAEMNAYGAAGLIAASWSGYWQAIALIHAWRTDNIQKGSFLSREFISKAGNPNGFRRQVRVRSVITVVMVAIIGLIFWAAPRISN